jgi:hypothetical protein
MYTAAEIEKQKKIVELARIKLASKYDEWEKSNLWDRIFKNLKNELDRASKILQTETDRLKEMTLVNKIDNEDFNRQASTANTGFSYLIPLTVLILVVGTVVYIKFIRK